MKIYYIEDENGVFVGEGGIRRFTRLCGKIAYDYLQTEEGKTRRFMKTTSEEDGGDEIYIEVPKSQERTFLVDKRHEQYVRDTIADSGMIIVSLSECTPENDGSEEDLTREDILADDTCVEDDFITKERKEILLKALAALNEAEMALITALFLQEKPISETEYSASLGITQQAMSKRKAKILKKLKKYF